MSSASDIKATTTTATICALCTSLLTVNNCHYLHSPRSAGGQVSSGIRVSHSPLIFFLRLFWDRSVALFFSQVRYPSRHPINSINAWKAAQRTDPNQLASPFLDSTFNSRGVLPLCQPAIWDQYHYNQWWCTVFTLAACTYKHNVCLSVASFF